MLFTKYYQNTYSWMIIRITFYTNISNHQYGKNFEILAFTSCEGFLVKLRVTTTFNKFLNKRAIRYRSTDAVI